MWPGLDREVSDHGVPSVVGAGNEWRLNRPTEIRSAQRLPAVRLTPIQIHRVHVLESQNVAGSVVQRGGEVFACRDSVAYRLCSALSFFDSLL